MISTQESPITRLVALPMLAARDVVQTRAASVLPLSYAVRPDALDAAIEWLCATHDATGRRGSSKGFSLLHGWLPAYPETTGYVIGTLLEYARRRGGRPELVERALEMGSWEAEVQRPDGGIMQGTIGTEPQRSIVFNTGQVLHGFVDLSAAGYGGYDDAAERAASFLLDNTRDDGTWNPEVEYSRLPHAYNSRVAWAMLRYAHHAGDDRVERAALRNLEWTLSQQRSNGWFDSCLFKPGTTPSTHAIAYTLRGLLESYSIVHDERYLDAVNLTSEVLMRKLEVIGYLPATYDCEWNPSANQVCLTGSVQLGGVWLRLYQIGGDGRYLNAGLKAIDQAVARQERSRSRSVNGALAGSFPIWGRYAPLQYPNWATKFMADSLMIREDCLTELP